MHFLATLSAGSAIISTALAAPTARQEPTFTVGIDITQSDIHNEKPPVVIQCDLNTLCTSGSEYVVSKIQVQPDSGSGLLNTEKVECRFFYAKNNFDPTGAPTGGVPFNSSTELYVSTNAVRVPPIICYYLSDLEVSA